ncbi:MAG: hypothetical protein QW743_05030 [Candidatus Methanomethylicia archaeon]
MKFSELIGTMLGLALAFILTQLLVYGVSNVGLFAYDNAPLTILKPDYSFHNLGVYISELLWVDCSFDVIAQAILIFASAIGVIALLREEVKH